MEVMRRKIWKLPLIAWLIIMLSIGLVAGVIMYTLKIPGTITIEPAPEGVYEIKVYSDAAGTQELTFVDFGTVKAGNSVPFSFYINNTGTVTVGIRMTITISGVASLNYGDIITNLEPGQIRYVDKTLYVSGTAGAGAYSVEIILEVYA